MTPDISKLLAQVAHPLPRIGSGPGFGLLAPGSARFPLTNVGAVNAVARIVSTLIGIITLVSGIYLIFQFLLAGFGWLTAAGDKNKLERAQNRITQSMLGIIIIVSTYALMSIVQAITGLDFLLINPAALIGALI